MKTPEMTIIVPIFNEQDNIIELQNRLVNVISELEIDYKILWVNDGSTDDSKHIIEKLSLEQDHTYYLNLTRNFGHQIAVSAGLNYMESDCCVIIDGDLQDPPELIKDLYTEYQKGVDVVYAKRQKRKGEHFLKKITAKLYYRVLKKLVPFDIPLDTADFRLMSKRVVEALNNMPEQNKYLRGQVAWLGFPETHVLYNRDSRQGGKSGYTIGKMFRLAFDGITGFSDKPLSFVSRIGFVISILSFLMILFAVFSHFVLKQTITGWTSLIITVSFIGGIQLLSVGVIGEYISRINKNVTQRPLYMIESENINKS